MWFEVLKALPISRDGSPVLGLPGCTCRAECSFRDIASLLLTATGPFCWRTFTSSLQPVELKAHLFQLESMADEMRKAQWCMDFKARVQFFEELSAFRAEKRLEPSHLPNGLAKPALER